MKIIIAGDGETGSHLAQMLSVENQDIVLIGYNRDHLAELDADGNFITIEGNPLSTEILMKCGADRADLFVAVTPDENVNLLSCQLAKVCGTLRCVARVDNSEFTSGLALAMLKSNGVDQTIFPEKLAAGEIAGFIGRNWVNEWMPVHNGELFVAGVRMEQGGDLCGKMLREVPNNPRRFHVSAIRRGETIIIPRGEDRLLEGDTIYFSVLPQDTDYLSSVCGKCPASVRHIMISGAGRVTENLLEEIGHSYEITVIDPDRRRCGVIASRFPRAVVVNAAVNDVNTLQEEGINRCDMFLALTGSSETNIVSCMVARQHGVKKTVARIEELQYMPEAESLSIDKIINKKLLNAGKIINILLDSSVNTAAQCMSLDKAEIICLTAKEGTQIVSQPVSELSLPRELTIGGLIRDGEAILVEGRTRVLPGDRVVIFFMAGALAKVARLFR